jgi:predicted pyridoxine 5'-phosphate oxidase superfamily flavin-nucleotide-binding protein
MASGCDVAFTAAVKKVQQARGSRAAYARLEEGGGWETEVTADLRAFLGEIDTAFLATATGDGQPYVQHRGGPRGFIRALDDHTLAFLDLAGNRQYLSTGNLTENDRVCLLLMDYRRRRRVKVWGTAEVVPVTAELRERLGEAGPEARKARPEQVVLIHVRAWDVNCPQHIPVKLDAAEVETVLRTQAERLQALEAENRELRARLAAAGAAGC